MYMVNNINTSHSDDSKWGSSPIFSDPTWNIGTGEFDHRLNPLKAKDTGENREQLIQAGQQFEAYFISYLLKVMRETVPEGTIGNKQGSYFYSFYDEEIGVRAAQSGGIGIAHMVQEYANKHFP